MFFAIVVGPAYSLVERDDSDLQCVVESAHPYQKGEDRSWPISIVGAEAVEVGLRCRAVKGGADGQAGWR